MAFTASYMAACITAKLRVGWTVAGCAPGVRTIVRSVLFHCMTGLSCAAVDAAPAEKLILRDRIAHAVVSDVESRDMFIPPVESSGIWARACMALPFGGQDSRSAENIPQI